MRTIGSGVLLGLLLATASPAWAQPDEGLPLPAAPSGRGIETGFDPARDGLPYSNVGSYASTNGDCFGMSLVSIDRFQTRKAGATRARTENDLPGQALAGVIQNRYLTEWHRGLGSKVTSSLRPVKDPSVGNQIIASLAAGTPVAVHLQSEGSAHVVVFYAYVGGSFLIYDPNHPNETRKWGFDEKKGFSSWTFAFGSVKSVAFYDPKDVAATPTLADLPSLRSSCDALDNVCAAPYMNVAVASEPRSESGGVALLVKGSVSGGLASDPEGRPSERPSSVVITVNGQVVDTVRIDGAGAFEVKLGEWLFADGTNDVRISAVTSHGRLAGFAELATTGKPGTVAPAAAPAQPTGRGLANVLGNAP